MIRPFRARYGVQDNMHALLEWEGHPAKPPAALLGLTDKPPGALAPGERWWPSVGCGPVDGWWALWWTGPDDQARRGGMVRSNVWLWHLNEVGTVDSLLPELEALGGQGAVPLPSTELLGAVAEALLSSNLRPPILADLDMWPGVIAALWDRLWPAARRAFSARVALSPPQGGESVAPPWIFGVPSERALQWREHRVITIPSGSISLSRAARWLVGEKDSTFDEVLAACPSLPADLTSLGRVARAADRLERLHEVPAAQPALDLLRTLLALAPTAEATLDLKKEGMSVLVRGLAEAPSTLVLALANLTLEHLPEGGTLKSTLKGWIRRRVPELPLDEASRLLESLSPGRSENWWQQEVRTALLQELDDPEPRWAKAAFHWLGLPSVAEALRAVLPASSRVEQRLLDATSAMAPSEAALRQLRQQAVERRWSRLHAWAVMQLSSPRETFQAQRAFPGDPSTGLEFLVERLPGTAVVEEALSTASTQFTELVARRTSREPELLNSLDVGHPAWRALWAAHVRAGGAGWPPSANREVLGGGLLSAVLAGNDLDGLVASLADGLADIALNHPERSALWESLGSAGRTALLPRVAEALIRRCNVGQVVPNVERQLGEAVLDRVRRTRPSARIFAALLQWDVQLGEDEAIQWLDGIKHSDWPPVVTAVGRAILARRWKRAASRLYDRCWYVSELRPAVEACQELLSPWERLRLSLSGVLVPPTGSVDTLLVNRVAELGARLAPDRLDDLWERAGGERRYLRSFGSPDARWREAAALAQNGSLPGGLATLVHELRELFPLNRDLEELWEVLVHRR